jgi:Family of unknown function (DUF5641)
LKRQKWRKKDIKKPSLGEVVFVIDEATKLFEWLVANIMKLNKRADRITRSAEEISGKKRVISQPLCKLIPLTISASPGN